ncbi:hypothetical protein RUM44_013249 [Polyplax serrata]|uniref:SOCS box domain-containing protein n=1 Tax=Polyplax serrata TaxID=468196 RepID=A0ABR1BHD6_POLSC
MDMNPLEQLLYGNIQENWANITEAIKLLILFRNDRLISNQSKQCYYQKGFSERRHPYLSSRDEDENTPLLYAGRRLLKEKCFRKALALCELLIQAGSDVNAANVEGRTLLSYSVQYFDESFELTRLLINSGATVWPLNIEMIGGNSHNKCFGNDSNTSNGCSVLGSKSFESQITNQLQTHLKPPSDVTNVFKLDKNKKEVLYFGPQIREGNNYERNSAFTWFLRSIIRCRKLNSNAEKTLAVLCEVMGENPERMHGHVMRTMFRHAKCFKVLGPVFYQLKSFMMPYWRQPKDLRYLCRKEIRKILGHGRLRPGVNKLALPKKMVNYILLE